MTNFVSTYTMVLHDKTICTQFVKQIWRKSAKEYISSCNVIAETTERAQSVLMQMINHYRNFNTNTKPCWSLLQDFFFYDK